MEKEGLSGVRRIVLTPGKRWSERAAGDNDGIHATPNLPLGPRPRHPPSSAVPSGGVDSDEDTLVPGGVAAIRGELTPYNTSILPQLEQ